MIVNDAPAFTEYIPCPMCNGKGHTIYQGIKRPCVYCRCAGGALHPGKLPVWDDDGRWQRKKVIGGRKYEHMAKER